MKLITPPLQKDSQGEEVKNLHYILYFFKQKLNDAYLNQLFSDNPTMEMYKTEVINKLYGDITVKFVVTVQMRFQFPVATGAIDGVTAKLFNTTLSEFGGLGIDKPENYPFEEDDSKEKKKFNVSGFVRNELGEGLNGINLKAFDVDLKGARVYKTAKRIDQLLTSGGMEFLGESVSKPDGSYNISFTEDKFSKVELGISDVIVYSIVKKLPPGGGNNPLELITAKSEISKSSDFKDGLSLENLNIVLVGSNARGISEFKKLLDKVNQFLSISNVLFNELFDSDDQQIFLANELEEDTKKVQILIKAGKLADLFPIIQSSHEILFGLGREGIELSMSSIAIMSEEKLINSINNAIKNNIVKEVNENEIKKFLSELHIKATNLLIDSPETVDAKKLIASLKIVSDDKKIQSDFIASRRAFVGKQKEFWGTYLPEQPAFKDKPELIKSLELMDNLSMLTYNNIALVEEFQKKQNIKTTSQLLRLSSADWNNVLSKTGIPENIPGENDAEKKNNYVDKMQTTLNAAFPTEKIALMIEDNEIRVDNDIVKEGLISFLKNNSDFDITSSIIINYNEKFDKLETGNEVKITLAKIQRLFGVSPTPEVLVKLMELGFSSARQIASVPEKTFIDTNKESLGGEELAFMVHQKASFQTMRIDKIYVSANELVNGATPNILKT